MISKPKPKIQIAVNESIHDSELARDLVTPLASKTDNVLSKHLEQLESDFKTLHGLP